MKLYITRHGQSLANTLHIISNRDLPHPLTPFGRLQAEELAFQLIDKGISRIFSSPIQRAAETAKIAGEILSLPVTKSHALREYDCGNLEGRGDAESWQTHKHFIGEWLAGRRRGESPPGGETFKDIQNRFVPFIEDLKRDYGKTMENLLLVTHGGLLLLGLPHILSNVDFPKARTLPLDNTIIIDVEFIEEKLVCRSWGNQVLT